MLRYNVYDMRLLETELSCIELYELIMLGHSPAKNIANVTVVVTYHYYNNDMMHIIHSAGRVGVYCIDVLAKVPLQFTWV